MKKTKMLKKNYQFKQVLTKGKYYEENEIEILVQKNNKNINYLGIAVSTKNGKAFQRNRAKRLIRESYKTLENRILEGNSIVILIKRNFDLKNMNYRRTIESLEKCFLKANILIIEEDKI